VVIGSPDLLRGVIETLRQRAERTTPSSGRVEVRSRLRVEGVRRVVEITVTDGGPRMTDEARARMFEPFPDAASLQEGTGLELAALAGVVRAHGGSMASLAAGEVGTTIVVRLPLRDGHAAAVKAGER
jgi:signal transduction histidine kinase